MHSHGHTCKNIDYYSVSSAFIVLAKEMLFPQNDEVLYFSLGMRERMLIRKSYPHKRQPHSIFAWMKYADSPDTCGKVIRPVRFSPSRDRVETSNSQTIKMKDGWPRGWWPRVFFNRLPWQRSFFQSCALSMTCDLYHPSQIIGDVIINIR